MGRVGRENMLSVPNSSLISRWNIVPRHSDIIKATAPNEKASRWNIVPRHSDIIKASAPNEKILEKSRTSMGFTRIN